MILTLILTLWNSCLKIRVNSATVEVEVDFEAELGKIYNSIVFVRMVFGNTI